MSFPFSGSIGGLIFGGLGFMGVILAAYFFVRQIIRLRRTVRAEGVVVESVVEQSQETTDSGDPTIDVLYFPKVSFRTASGAEIVFKSSTGSDRPNHAIGARLPIRYDPNRPKDAEIDGFWENWLLPVGLGFMGLCFILVGLATMAGSVSR